MKNSLIRFAVGCASLTGILPGAFAQENSNRLVGRSDSPVIYGKDDRTDLFDSIVTRQQAQWSKSVAALIHTTDLTTDGATKFKLPTKTYQEQMNLCESEPFAMQPSPAFCTGFLVAPNLVATAGHCIEDQTGCENISFVFDFAYSSANTDLSTVSTKNVYKCKKVLGHSLNDDIDYSVVEIDRPALDRPALSYRTKGEIANGTELTLIGHPSGLPLKIAPSAHVREMKADKGFFVASTDSYGGNSGSPVINSRTGEVEGILVRGDADFECNDQCCVSKVCAEDECRGEDSTLISNILPYLPKN